MASVSGLEEKLPDGIAINLLPYLNYVNYEMYLDISGRQVIQFLGVAEILPPPLPLLAVVVAA